MSEFFAQCNAEFNCVKNPGVGPFSRTLLFELINAIILAAAALRVQIEDQGRVKHKRDASRKPRFGFGAGYVRFALDQCFSFDCVLFCAGDQLSRSDRPDFLRAADGSVLRVDALQYQPLVPASICW